MCKNKHRCRKSQVNSELIHLAFFYNFSFHSVFYNTYCKHPPLSRYSLSSSSGLRPFQRRSQSEFSPSLSEEPGIGCPLMSALAIAKIILRTEGIANWPSNVFSSDSKFSFVGCECASSLFSRSFW